MAKEKSNTSDTATDSKTLPESVASYVSNKLGVNLDANLKKVIENQVKSSAALGNVDKQIQKLSVALQERGAKGATATPVDYYQKSLENQIKQTTALTNIEKLLKTSSATSPATTVASPNASPAKSQLEEEEGPKPILIGGFTQEGLKAYKEALPEILNESLEKVAKKLEKNQKKDDKGSGGGGLLGALGTGLGILAAGGALIIGGLAAFVKGLMDDGPFKGLLKILSRVGIEGGIGILKVGASKVVTAIRDIVAIPSKFFKNIIEKFPAIGKVLEKISPGKIIENLKGKLDRAVGFIKGKFNKIIGAFSTIASKVGGFFGRIGGTISKILPKGGLVGKIMGMFKGLFAKFAGKGLTKIPVIGTIIGVSFAISRLLKGDVVGGLIDLASALVAMVPGVGTAISLGIDAIGMFLDFKAGEGTGAEKSAAKGSMILDWFKGLGTKVIAGVKKLPVVGPLLKAIGHFKDAEWGKGFKQLAYVVPFVELIGGMLGDEEASSVAGSAGKAIGNTSLFGGLVKWFKTSYEKIPILGPLIKGVKSLFAGQWAEGFKNLAFAIPGVELIAGMFGAETTSAAGEAGKGVRNVFDHVLGWLSKKVATIPVIGPLITGVKALFDGEWAKGFKSLAFAIPGVEMIAGFFGAETPTVAGKAGEGARSIFNHILGWLDKKVGTIPVIGPLIQGVKSLLAGQWADGFKNLAFAIPGVEMIAGFFGADTTSAAGEAGKGVRNIFDHILGWFKENYVKIPIIGPLIQGVKSLFAGQWADGFKNLAFAIPGVETIAGFFGAETTSAAGEVGKGARNIFDHILNWFKEKVDTIPIIGPLIKGVKSIFAGSWADGFKTLALAIPGANYIAGLFESFGETAEGGEEKEGIFSKILNWFKENYIKIPIIGPLITGIKALSAGQWIEGFKNLAFAIPGTGFLIEFVTGMLGGSTTSAIGDAGSATGDFFKNIGKWLYEKIYDIPILGNIIEGIKTFATSPIESLRTMAKSIPLLSSIIDFFDGKPETAGEDMSPPKSLFQSFREWIFEKVKDVWKALPWMLRKALGYVLPDNLVKELSDGMPPDAEGEGMIAGAAGKALEVASAAKETLNKGAEAVAEAGKQVYEKGAEIANQAKEAVSAVADKGKEIVGGALELGGKGVDYAKEKAAAGVDYAKEKAAAGVNYAKEKAAAIASWRPFGMGKKEEKPPVVPAITPEPVKEAVANTSSTTTESAPTASPATNTQAVPAITPEPVKEAVATKSQSNDPAKLFIDDPQIVEWAKKYNNKDEIWQNEGAEVYNKWVEEHMPKGGFKPAVAKSIGRRSLELSFNGAKAKAAGGNTTISQEKSETFKPGAAKSDVPEVGDVKTSSATAAPEPSVSVATPATSVATSAPNSLSDKITSAASSSTGNAAQFLSSAAATKQPTVKIEGSMESLLTAIANNTGGTTQNIKGLIGGFNALAKALEEKLGVQVPPVQPAAPQGPSISEYAHQGNPDIASFRSTMEGARPRGF